MAIAIMVSIIADPIGGTWKKTGVCIIAIVSTYADTQRPISVRVSIHRGVITVIIQAIVIGFFLSRIDAWMGIITVETLGIAIAVCIQFTGIVDADFVIGGAGSTGTSTSILPTSPTAKTLPPGCKRSSAAMATARCARTPRSSGTSCFSSRESLR